MNYELRYGKTDRICKTVNTIAPDFDISIVSPDDVTFYRAANCYAKAMLVAAGMRLEGTSLTDMSVLVGTAHGAVKSNNSGSDEAHTPFWFGHALLILHDEDPAVAFDTSNRIFCYDASVAGWEPNYKCTPPMLTVDRERLFLPQEEYADTGIPPNIWKLQSYMTVHGLDESIRYYQSAHPELAADRPWHFGDYMDVYCALDNSDKVLV